jgi:hypothetical protein
MPHAVEVRRILKVAGGWRADEHVGGAVIVAGYNLRKHHVLDAERRTDINRCFPCPALIVRHGNLCAS